MRLKAHYSSSASNLYEVTASNGRRILIECGCTWKQLQKALDYKLDKIDGCLVSHQHLDHSKCIEDVMLAGIPIYSSLSTFEALGVAEDRHANIVGDKDRFEVGDTFEVFSFALFHDVPCLGFIVHDKSSDENLLFVTDTSHIKQRFGIAFDIIAICCGYDGAVLAKRQETGDINEALAIRLLTAHMERNVTKRYIAECCCLDKCTEIYLLHMSGGNISQEATRQEFEDEFLRTTHIAGRRRTNHDRRTS